MTDRIKAMASHLEIAEELFKDPAVLAVEIGGDPLKAAYLHIALGLAGEALEYATASSIKNAREEIGDILFFAAALMNQNEEFRVGEITIIRGTDPHFKILLAAGTLADALKKYAIYDRPLDMDRAQKALTDLYTAVNTWCSYYAASWEDLVMENIAKLRQRFPDGYTDMGAAVRKDKLYRHKRRGHVYRVLDVEKLTTTRPLDDMFQVVPQGLNSIEDFEAEVLPEILAGKKLLAARLQTEQPLLAGVHMMVYYRAVDPSDPSKGNQLWARPMAEFLDGRFEEVEE